MIRQSHSDLVRKTVRENIHVTLNLICHFMSDLNIFAAPSIFEPVLSLMRPLMTASTREAFTTVGYDREEWKRYIDVDIDVENLPVRYGGTKQQKINKLN